MKIRTCSLVLSKCVVLSCSAVPSRDIIRAGRFISTGTTCQYFHQQKGRKGIINYGFEYPEQPELIQWYQNI